MAKYEPKKIVRAVYFQMFLILLLGLAFVLHTKYTEWQEERAAKGYEVTMEDWSRLVSQFGLEGARKKVEELQRVQPKTGFPKIFFFAVLVLAIYISARARAMTGQYEGKFDIKAKMQVDLAFTLLAFLAYVLSFTLIRFRMVSEDSYARWLYAPIVLSVLVIAHYFYRPLRVAVRNVIRFLTKPFKRKVVKLEELERKEGKFRKPR